MTRIFRAWFNRDGGVVLSGVVGVVPLVLVLWMDWFYRGGWLFFWLGVWP
jgi:hypothetical protein